MQDLIAIQTELYGTAEMLTSKSIETFIFQTVSQEKSNRPIFFLFLDLIG